MKIVQATYETEEKARESYADLMKYKSHLAEFSDFENKSIIVRCSSKEKAEEVKEDIRAATGEPEKLKVFDSESEEDESKISKIKEGFEGLKKGLQKGAKQTQQAASSASEQIGGASRAPEGGMISQVLGGGSSGGSVVSVRAVYGSEDEVLSAMDSLAEKGIPKEAMDGVKELKPEKKWILSVRCSSEEKAKKAEKYVEDVSNPKEVKRGGD